MLVLAYNIGVLHMVMLAICIGLVIFAIGFTQQATEN